MEDVFGLNDLGDNTFLDGLESEGACTVANSSNVWNDLDADNAFLTREIGTHVVTQDEVDNGIRGLLQISILTLADGADLNDTIFTIELGGAIQTFELPSHGGVVDIEFVQIPAVLDTDGNEVTPARDQRPTSTGNHSFIISKRSKTNSQDPGGVVSGSFSVLLNNEGGAVIVKPAVAEVLDESYSLTFNDTPNEERTLGVDFTRVTIDTDDDAETVRNRDTVTATVNTSSLNLSVPGFEHSGTTGVTEGVPAVSEVNTVLYSGTTSSDLIAGEVESFEITIGANSTSGTLTGAPVFDDITNNLANVQGVAYDGVGLYVAIAEGKFIYTSPDGVNWTVVSYSNIGSTSIQSTSFTEFRTITYGNGRFVLTMTLTNNGCGTVHSTNGFNWDVNVFSSISPGGRIDVKFLNGSFYYWGIDHNSNNFLGANSDGAGDAVAITQANSSPITDMASDENGLVIAGHDTGTGSDGIITYSISGGSFVSKTIVSSGFGRITSIVYGNGLWVFSTSFGQAVYGTDPVNTSLELSNPPSQGHRIRPGVYIAGFFIIADERGDAIYSTNGINWSKIVIAEASDFIRVASGGNRAFLVGNKFYREELGELTTVTLTLEDHLTEPLVFTISNSSNANQMASQIATALNNAITGASQLTNPLAINNVVSFSSTVSGDQGGIASLQISSNSQILDPIETFVITDGSADTTNVIKDSITLSNIDITRGHVTNTIVTFLGFGLSGDSFRDAIISIFNTVGGYNSNSVSDGVLTFTSISGGLESDIDMVYTQANDSTADVSTSVTTQGADSLIEGEVTKLIYTIQGIDYNVTFPSGVPTANQQALFTRSSINASRGNPITDGTDFVMSVNGSLLNFRVPEGTAFTDHLVSLGSSTDPNYTGGTLVNANNPVGTYVLPEVVSNVLSLTEFRDTVNTSEYKGVDFTEDKSIVVGKVSYTWNDYTAGGLFQELTTDNEGITVKLLFSTTGDGVTPAFVYRRITAAGTENYSDIVYAEESLTTILATRGG